MTTGVNAATAVAPQSFESLNLEAELMAVQITRANLLEGSLVDQLNEVKNRNAEIAKLNQTLNALRSVKGDKKDDAEVKINSELSAADRANLNSLLKDANVKDIPSSLAAGSEVKTNGATINTWIEAIKGKIDSLNSTQQLAMVRMQSLMNKRNEAFDLLSTCLKKFADANSSIIQKF